MKCGAMVGWVGGCLLAAMTAGAWGGSVDYAESRHVGLWLQDPVLGGPSFDSFVHSARNPLMRGVPLLSGR